MIVTLVEEWEDYEGGDLIAPPCATWEIGEAIALARVEVPAHLDWPWEEGQPIGPPGLRHRSWKRSGSHVAVYEVEVLETMPADPAKPFD